MRPAWQLAPGDLLQEVIAALVAHPLRALLSGLGIVLGIATVIAALAIGEGARRSALAEIGTLGVNNILLRSIAQPAPPGTRSRSSAPELAVNDAEVIAASLENLAGTAAARVSATDIRSDLRLTPATLAGVTASWAGVFDLHVGTGRWLSGDDERGRSRVAVIGAGLARDLFGDRDPVGSRIAAGGNWFLIVGVLAAHGAEQQGSALAREFEPDRSLLVPLGAMDVSLGRGDSLDRVNEIAVRLRSPSDVEPAALAIAAIVRARHGAGGYELIVPRQLLAARLRARRSFDVVLGAVGLVALLISGVGIMNIMLASVAERTHEIGVRRAMGARRADVLAQFALEAAVLCAAGGLVGIPLGVVMSVIVALAAGWPISLSAWGVGLAVALATSVGLASGIYPARLASRVCPVEALRAE